MPKYKAKQGDCIEIIALQYGIFWETVWNHPDNAELKRKREDPNILFVGDVVFVPEKRILEESGATEERHRFKRKGVPAKLRLQLLDDDEPRVNEDYILNINGELSSGKTDAEGNIEIVISPNARSGKLIVGEDQDVYELELGHLDPISETTGVQARLNNLGFDCGTVDGIIGRKTETALREFQKKNDLEESGEINEETRNALAEAHGS